MNTKSTKPNMISKSTVLRLTTMDGEPRAEIEFGRGSENVWITTYDPDGSAKRGLRWSIHDPAWLRSYTLAVLDLTGHGEFQIEIDDIATQLPRVGPAT